VPSVPSPTGLPKGSPHLWHTAAFNWALAMSHLFKRHSLTLWVYWGMCETLLPRHTLPGFILYWKKTIKFPRHGRRGGTINLGKNNWFNVSPCGFNKGANVV
jgi:hypothetical protein